MNVILIIAVIGLIIFLISKFGKQSLKTFESKYKMAEKKYFDKEFVESIEILTELISEFPHYQSYGLRGSCYFELNNLEKAIADYSKSIELEPSQEKNSMAYNRVEKIKSKVNSKANAGSNQKLKKQTNINISTCYLMDGIKKLCQDEQLNIKDFIKEIDLASDNDNELVESANNPSRSTIAKKLINKIYRPYRISQIKRRINSDYYNYFLHHGSSPDEISPWSPALRMEQKILSYFCSPSLKKLIKEEQIITMMNSGIYKILSPGIQKFPFRPVFLYTIPDVILWYYDSGNFNKIKVILKKDFSELLDKEGFISIDNCAKLIDQYINDSGNNIECVRSWD